MIAWPDVQPPAYRAPKPTRNPPITINMKPLTVNNDDQLKISAGRMFPKSCTPNALRWVMVASETVGDALLDRKV